MPAPAGVCLNAYKSFQACKNNYFQIIYGAKQASQASHLLILDSSFNPPHWGHLTLIKKGLQFYEEKPTHVLLMISINNADKAPQPATFDKRMEMMCLMADILREEHISTSVGITSYGKYVDKYKVLKETFFLSGSMAFLVGFDTITRIFEPKYYAPHLPSEALKTLMVCSEFCCLTRPGEDSHDKQINYADDISKGKYEPIIPRSWGKKIHMLINDKNFEGVSSSSIRKNLKSNCSFETLTKQLPPSIINYIQSQQEPIFQ